MRSARRLWAVLSALLVLVAVGTAPAQSQDGGGFDLFAFFEGASVSEGRVTTAWLFETPLTATFEGHLDGEVFTLVESFRFPDGAPKQIWRLERDGGHLSGTVETEQGDGTFAAPAPVEGSSDETGVTLHYTGIAPGGGGLRLAFRHHMRMQGDGTVENRVRVSKFGLPLARSTVTFAKSPSALPSHRRER